MNKDEIIRRVNMLVLQNQLLTMDIANIKEIYVNKNNYKQFLDTALDLAHYEEEYLLIDSFIIPNIQEIVKDIRTNYPSKENIFKINELIIAYNKISAMTYDEKYSKFYNYIKNSLRKRDIYLNVNIETFKQAIIYDAYVYDFLTTDKDAVIAQNYFCSSLNYLLYYIPSIFNNELVETKSKLALNCLLDTLENDKVLKRKDKKLIKININNTMTNLNNTILNNKVKVKRKEE